MRSWLRMLSMVALLLLSPQAAYAAFSVENISSSSVGPASSLTFAFTVTSANKLVVLAGTGSGTSSLRSILTVTFNGVALTIKGEADDNAYSHAEIWELDAPSVGTFNVVITLLSLPTGTNEIFGAAIGFIDARVPSGAVAAANGTTVNPSITAASEVDDIVVGLVSNDNEATAQTEDFTLIGEAENVNADMDFNAERRTASGATTQLTWTNATSSSGWAAVAMAVKPAVAAVAGCRLLQDGVSKRLLQNGTDGRILQGGGGCGLGGGGPVPAGFKQRKYEQMFMEPG